MSDVMIDPRRPFNIHRADTQRKPPLGWTVDNVLYQRLLTQATRTGCQGLIDQVTALRTASRSELVCVLEVVAQAAKGRINPASVDLQKMIQKANV